MKYSILFFLITICSLFFSKESEKIEVASEDKVSKVLKDLGDDYIPHYPKFTKKGISVENGRNLFLNGFSVNKKGKKSEKQSNHFVCTSCHNIQQEDPDLSVSDPQARLEYVSQKGMPFLQATTMYGAVNRTSFYNGDYHKKYGDLVDKARNDIREAIQLCAVECAQGRPLKYWELESILAYLWTLELKMDDLNLSSEEYTQINNALNDSGDKQAVREMLHTKFLKGAPATFIEPPEDRATGEKDYVGNPENGKLVYDLSCKHCHENERYSFFALDDSKDTFNYLKRHIPKYTRYSIYQVIRWGTSPIPGKGAYMPQYTQEKMSKQQLEDLRAYIESQAK